MADEYEDSANISDQKKELQRLLDSPAWGHIIGVIQQQTDSLQNEILFAPITSEADLYMLERKKGMLEGRLSLSITVETMLENLAVDFNEAVAKKASE
jgi:hypothetical protein